MNSNKIKIYSLSIALVALFLCQIPFFAVGNGAILKNVEVERENISLYEIEQELRQDDLVGGAQKITLIQGDNSPNVEEGIMTLIMSLSDEIKVLKENSMDLTEILVIFAHGTEEGIVFGDEIVSWSDLASILQESNTRFVFLAACYGTKIYEFIQVCDPLIFAFPGMVDAKVMGYVISCIINIYYGYRDIAAKNLELSKQRVVNLQENPDKILPLAWFKIKRNDAPFWTSEILFYKFTEAESNNFGLILIIITAICVMIGLGTAGLGSAFAALIEAHIFLIAYCLDESRQAHSSGAMISFEFVGIPPYIIPVLVQARGPDERELIGLPLGASFLIGTPICLFLRVAATNNPGLRNWNLI